MAEEKTIKDGADTIVIQGDGFDKLFNSIPKEGNVPVEDDELKDGLSTKTEEELKLEAEAKEKEEAERLAQEAKKKEEPKTDDEDSIISIFKEKYGDVEGEFDETLDGLESYIDKIIPTIKEEAKLEAIEELKETRPEVKALIEHLDAGYALNSFATQQQLFDYSKVVINDEDDNIEVQKELYRQALEVRGLDKEDIDDQLELAVDKGTIKGKAELAKEFLIKTQKVEIDKIKAAEKAAYDAAIKEAQEVEKEIDTILKTGNLGGIKLDTQQIKALRDFGTKKDAKGVTERERKWSQLTIEQSLILDQIVLNDFKGLGVKVNKDVAKNKTLQELKKKSEEVQKVKLNNSNNSLTDNKNQSPVKSIKDWI